MHHCVSQASAFTDWLLASRYLFTVSDELFTLGAGSTHTILFLIF